MEKLSKQEAIKLINRFIENRLPSYQWFEDIKLEVKAVLLYGSTAKETNRSDSDVDVLIIVPAEVEKRYTEGEYFYDFEERSINIVLRSVERLRKLAKEKSNFFQAEVFRDAVILKESDSEVRDLLTSWIEPAGV